jgi:cytochrome P450
MTATSEARTLPGAWPLVGHFPAYSRDPLGFVTTSTRTHGGVVPIRFGPSPALLITDPAAIEEVLVSRHRDFQKGRAGQRVGVVVGEGILLSEGETWREHRRIVQPAFHHDRIKAWGEVMASETESMLAGWADGDVRDIHADMSALTLAIVGRTLLDSRIEPADVAEVQAAAATLTDHFDSRFNSLRFFLPDALPTPGNRRMRAAVGRLDRIVYRLITARRAAGTFGDDAISMLLEASEADSHPLTDAELRDEVMTLFMAGHETTAVALSWALYLLAKSPGVEAPLAAEVADVLGGRRPSVADLPGLRLTEAVVFETLRLYPPAYALSREAISPTSIGGHALPKRGIAFISVWAAHRRPEAFDQPETFRPERWLDGLARRLARGAYLPFAEGPRKCIGAAFAMQEMVLVLAGITQRFHLRHVAGADVRPRPAVTLRPADPVRIAVSRRDLPARVGQA